MSPYSLIQANFPLVWTLVSAECILIFSRQSDIYYLFTNLHLGSGLSSSAAFVCSATIALMAAFDVNFPKVYYPHQSSKVVTKWF